MLGGHVGSWLIKQVFPLGSSRLIKRLSPSGKRSNKNEFIDYGATFGAGDVVGCRLDLDQRFPC